MLCHVLSRGHAIRLAVPYAFSCHGSDGFLQRFKRASACLPYTREIPEPCACPRLQANGADIHGGTWFETGAEMLNGGTLNYFAVPWGVINHPLPLVLVSLIEAGLMGAVETYRCAARLPV